MLIAVQRWAFLISSPILTAYGDMFYYCDPEAKTDISKLRFPDDDFDESVIDYPVDLQTLPESPYDTISLEERNEDSPVKTTYEESCSGFRMFFVTEDGTLDFKGRT